MPEQTRERDLVLPVQQFAHVLDHSKGFVNTLVGPTKSTLSEQERAVRYNPQSRKFDVVPSLEQAVQPFIAAAEGEYVVLENPARQKENEHPVMGNSNNTPQLEVGRKINIPGPVNFPLWPGQVANVIPGHILRSNQYVLCRVYNADAAKANWNRAVSVPQTDKQSAQETSDVDVDKLVTGQLLIMTGTKYSFFIPPTGIEVLQDENTGEYVREACTLESLEYCIKINEQGDKSYERGPQVVFPKPNEKFLTTTNAQGQTTRRFRALDLSKLQGIYVQVIAPYNDDGSPVDPEARKAKNLEPKEPDHKAGEELFITGKDQAIYYPRTEHAIIKYNDSEKHNAIAIPKGEGRYVLKRLTGDIDLVKGPFMLLPNPIEEVVVRRIIPTRQVKQWFPDNNEAVAYNEQLAAMAQNADVSSQSFVTDNSFRSRTATRSLTSTMKGGDMAASLEALAYTAPAAASAQFGDQVKRGSTYTPPRTITLDTKYDGAVRIAPYIGYAVQVVSKTGQRKVVVGPDSCLLEYDETLEVMTLSTGKPKTDSKTVETVYLKIHNNTVSDILTLETADMVKVTVTLSYRVNFEGDTGKWFAVDNYVRLLCDAIRSRLTATVKKIDVQAFYANAADIIRDTILGKPEVQEGQTKPNSRPGLRFHENNMRVFDVEVLKVEIVDPTIAQMLNQTMVAVFKNNVDLAEARRRLTATQETERINQQIADAKAATKRQELDLQKKQVAAEFDLTLARIANGIREAEQRLKSQEAVEAINDLSAGAARARQKAEADQELAIEDAKQKQSIEMIKAEVDALVKKFTAFQGPLGEILMALSNAQTLEKLAAASAPMTILGGTNITEVIGKALSGTAYGKVFETLMEKVMPTDGSGLRPQLSNR